jgi:KRAB domain-containing zinc finger protein
MVFAQDGDITEHTDTVEEKLICDICGKGFTRPRGNLPLSHRHIHTRDKPFKCDICGEGFTVKTSLVGHEHTY